MVTRWRLDICVAQQPPRWARRVRGEESDGAPQLTSLDGNMFPTAPQDALSTGIEAAIGKDADGSTPPSYMPKIDRTPYAFPEQDSSLQNVTQTGLRGQRLECHDSPRVWQDLNGNPCSEYDKGQWCKKDGSVGPGWQAAWGVFTEWSAQMHNDGPRSACCACGGGVSLVSSTDANVPMEQRWLQAPEDTVAGEIVAPSDRLPEQFMESASVAAPFDRIPSQFSHFLTESEKQRRKPDMLGLTARFYKTEPSDSCDGPSPASSSIDRALDYRMGSTGGFQRSLKEKASLADMGSYYYGKWTGTLNILMSGAYQFDLDIPFDTTSSIKIDGKKFRTKGQCRIAQDEQSCAMKGCTWEQGTCVSSVPGAPGPAAAVSTSEFLPASNSSRRGASPWSSAGALSFLDLGTHVASAPPAASPAASPAVSRAVSPAAAFAAAPPAPAPAPAPSVQASTTAPVPASAPVAAPAAAPATHEDLPGGEFELSAGGHCLEVVVRLDSSSKALQLRYSGPDTDNKETVIPGQVLFCDPVIAACEKPELESCGAFRTSCTGNSASPGPAPAPAPSLSATDREKVQIPAGWKMPEMVPEVSATS
eukprot:TRINITY_DN18992_c0_g1_i2.p1 TRINITY_DN18992_c0_g1~~TRINITY_DN18992_c0_g1_i2.p1  ORF type:complete len:591 (+),score=108.22 TRINITY_DN18992_c0_g1_i2:188-1960(+)